MNSESRQSAEGSRQLAASWPREPAVRDAKLLAGYREMADDQEHEAEALEWCEGLIGDAIQQRER
jgi:hypothetical protein